MVEIKNIDLEFGDLTIFKNMSLSVKKGETVLITGPNGTGKTLLFKLLLKLVIPDKGSINVAGINLANTNKIYGNIGALIETPTFIEYFSGYDNLLNLSKIRKKTTPQKIESLMKEFKLEINNKPIKKYSLGMRQKIGIIQAIMEDQDLLLLDEPINSLDSDSTEIFINLINALKSEGKTIIMISHIDSRLSEIADTIYKLENYKFNKIVKEDE